MWFFSTLVVSNSLGASPTIPPPLEHQPHVDPFPYFSIKSSSLSDESLDTSNQEVKRKHTTRNKKKKNKQEEKLPTIVGHSSGNQPAIVHQVVSIDNVKNPKNIGINTKKPLQYLLG